MKKTISAAFLFLLACSKPVGITPGLKKAWVVVNTSEDIYAVHSDLEMELTVINNELEVRPHMNSIQDLDNRKAAVMEDLTQEQARVLSIQKQVEKASEAQLDLLSKI